MSVNMVWPIALIVLSNVFYNICAKSTPTSINPYALLSVTYVIGAICSGVMYFALNKGGNLLREFQHLNWSAFVLGVAIVGLEVGSIYMYKAGWNISTGQLVHSSILAIALILIGCLFYHDAITKSKVIGILICIVGLYFINK